MSGRGISKNKKEKPKLSSTERRKIAASDIEEFGFEVMPCSRCFDLGLTCKLLGGKKRCQECLESNATCDGKEIPIDSIARIGREKRRLELQEEEEEQRLAESVARLARLRKLRRLLHDKGIKLIQREYKSIEELEEQERLEEEQAKVQAEITAASEVAPSFSWGGVNLDPNADPSSVLAGLDFGDGTAQQVPERSSSH